ncbi:MAG TPA: LysR family transcriptional regulator [Prolixibacteraceae bacterium]|nr:LysR family transcriptional regulator [Prolixibacteraceae bacterium]
MMDIRFIKLITIIVDYGSISNAAKKLNLTQSALSHQLGEFERQAGVLFFTRSNRRLRLTPAGQLVYDSAQNILAEVEKLESRLKNIQRSGRIRISAACTTNYHWLPQLVKRFKTNYPDVDIEIVIDISGNPVEEILKGNLDVAILNTPVENNKISYTYLFDDEMVAVFSHQHRFNEKSYLIAKDFEKEHLIIHSRPLSTVVFYENVLKPKGVEPLKISELPLTEAAIELIRADYGVAVMPQWTIRPYVESNLVATKRINRNGFFRRHYAAQLSGIEHPDYISSFIEYLKTGMG